MKGTDLCFDAINNMIFEMFQLLIGIRMIYDVL